MMKKFDDNIDKVILGMKKLVETDGKSKCSTQGEEKNTSRGSHNEREQDLLDSK
jgi:hypothetical protein